MTTNTKDKDILSFLGELRDFDIDTYRHSLRVGRISYQFANYLNSKGNKNINLRTILLSGYLHDIGKIFIDKKIFFKEKLLEEEFNIIKEHSLNGFRYLVKSNTKLPKEIYYCALLHHKGFSNKGYPKNIEVYLKDIQNYVDIISIIDIYDALSSKRCYKDSFQLNEVFEIMDKMGNTQINNIIYLEFKLFLKDTL